MITISNASQMKQHGFIFMEDYGGGLWTNGRIHFIGGNASDNCIPKMKDLDTLAQMIHDGTLARTPSKGENA